MFDILVYLYETYYRPESCPDAIVLAKKLSEVGFDENEIIEALDWLSGMTIIDNQSNSTKLEDKRDSFRVYTEHEYQLLGTSAIGFIEYLYSVKLLDAQQREIVLESAMAVDESPISMKELKIVVLMLLWSQGREPEVLMYDDLLLTEENPESRPMH